MSPHHKSYSNCHEQARPLHLTHVGDVADIVCLERPDDLPVLAHDPDLTILRAKEQAVRSRAHARYLVALEERLGVVLGECDLGDFEEVKRLPLR
jgi:hypothetical protein